MGQQLLFDLQHMFVVWLTETFVTAKAAYPNSWNFNVYYFVWKINTCRICCFVAIICITSYQLLNKQAWLFFSLTILACREPASELVAANIHKGSRQVLTEIELHSITHFLWRMNKKLWLMSRVKIFLTIQCPVCLGFYVIFNETKYVL